MNDVFFLTDKKVSLNELIIIFAALTNCTIKVSAQAGMLQTWCNDAHIDLTLMSADEFSDPADLETLSKHCISTVILISYHENDKAQLDKYAAMLSDTFGGWLGQDADGFAPLVSADN